ncbi:MAG: hypothetical protein R2762_29890 [Bryobacteraceae bacterium]
MNRLLFIVVLLMPAAAAAQETAEILAQLSGITGLEVRERVIEHTMKRDELKAYFDERIDEAVKPEEIRIEELALKKLGFVPADFDLRKTTVDLMSEQAAAFYDYRKKKMVLLEGDPGVMRDMALVHELAHALADQHFRLEKFLKKAGSSDDSALARMAVMEGQATWLMSEFMAKRMGQSLLENGNMVSMMSRMAGSAGSGFPVFSSVPLYMKESLVFPYSQGMVFQHRVVEKLGKDGFAEVFRNPPQSTREILHPEKYIDGEKPVAVKLPQPPRKREWKELAEGTVGEFDHLILLRQTDTSMELLAESWRGGKYALWENKKDKNRVALAYVSAWADEKAARDFFRVYKAILTKKWKSCEFREETGSKLAGVGDDGHFVTRLEGRTVISLEGLPEAAE